MAEDLNKPMKKEKPKSKLVVRLMRSMLLLVLIQLITFFAILTISGEFTFVRQYAYNNLIEKTENRMNYVENEMQQKIPFVQEASEKINGHVAEILAEQNASIDDIQTDKDLNRLIMESSVDMMVDLLRRSTANDVYLILETGSLYQDTSANNAKVALYLRDLDTSTDAGYEDLLMEIGFSSISQEFGIILDSGWSLHYDLNPEDVKNTNFYYRTMETAQENSTISYKSLGYWSGFSNFSQNASPSMKYTVPLIAEDGTVYGVIGIGLTENTILSNLPANDFISEDACYILGHSKTDDQFEIITHSGISFNRFLGNADILQLADMLDKNIYSFSIGSELDLVGNVQYMTLYNQDSPYYNERWALISMADRNTVLTPLNNLMQMLIMSAIVSLLISIAVAILSGRAVVKPISNVIETMNAKRKYNHVIRFQPSKIYEIDEMTDAITQLQINVLDFSSQVSQMIRIADVGLGTFMYDREDDSVFVGQSLLKLLRFQMEQDEDVMMSRKEFLENIIAKETRQAVTESLELVADEEQTDYTKEYSVIQEDGTTIWMRLGLVHNKNKSIGILQDITNEMMEKKRIEYERDYDTITGLLNRRAYYNRIEHLFQDTSALKVAAFVMIDLDNLKYVNDTYGHDFGDDYIKTAATTLKKFQDYGGIVSRLSGDEFNVCLPGFSSKDEVREILNEIREQLLQSYCLLADGTHFKIRASAGVAWYPDDAQSYEMLMKYADFAMYTIKHSTKGGLTEFDKTAYAKDSVLITGVEEMNRIIDECAVRYAFHSIVSVKTGEIYGYEALMRPQSTVFQSPMELLRIAKTSAKLYEIERMTWTKAFVDFEVQIAAGRIAEDSHIFINSISNCSLEPSDVEAIEADHWKLLPQVVLEVLENENVNEEYNARKHRRMKKWGAQVALDDFGTGYNSEYALITMKPNIIKIDRSIISGCDKDISRRTIINSLVKLAKTKQILVLAEGVETEDELRTVINCGVDLLQGYYFNRPLFEPQPLESEKKELIQLLAKAAEDKKKESNPFGENV